MPVWRGALSTRGENKERSIEAIEGTVTASQVGLFLSRCRTQQELKTEEKAITVYLLGIACWLGLQLESEGGQGNKKMTHFGSNFKKMVLEQPSMFAQAVGQCEGRDLPSAWQPLRPCPVQEAWSPLPFCLTSRLPLLSPFLG